MKPQKFTHGDEWAKYFEDYPLELIVFKYKNGVTYQIYMDKDTPKFKRVDNEQ